MIKRLVESLRRRSRAGSAPVDDESPPVTVTTGGGDQGQSSLYTGERDFKDADVFEALGDIDELNSWLGVIRRKEDLGDLGGMIPDIQSCLGRILSVLATSPRSSLFEQLDPVGDIEIARLEHEQRSLKGRISLEPRFITPGEDDGIPELDVVRAVARRCERRVVRVIHRSGRPDPEIRQAQIYLNRLSDYLFVLARAVEQRDSE